MHYLLLCCFDEKKWASLPQSQRDSIMDRYGQWVQQWKTNGKLLGGAKLNDTASAITLRERNGESLVVDGPFAETKEQLGGYHVIECRDRNEAIAIARQIPTLAAGGVVEVRPISWQE